MSAGRLPRPSLPLGAGVAVAAALGWLAWSRGTAPPAPGPAGARHGDAPSAPRVARPIPVSGDGARPDAPRRAVANAAARPTVGMLNARVLDPDGAPLANAWCAIDAPWTGDGRTIAATLADGTLAVPIVPTDPAPRPGVPVSIRLASRGETADPFASGMHAAVGLSPGAQAPHAEVRVPWPEDGGALELGAVVLEHAALLLDGVVVDPLGHPLPGDVDWAIACDIPAPVSVEGGARLPLDPDADFYAWLDGRGRFALHGRAIDGTRALDVRARHPGAQARTFTAQRFALGARGVIVQLEAERTLTAHVVLPPGTSMAQLDVAVGPPTPRVPGFGDTTGVVRTKRDGYVEVTIDRLPPGRHDLQFLLGGTVVARLADVVVPADGPCADPRLRRVELRR